MDKIRTIVIRDQASVIAEREQERRDRRRRNGGDLESDLDESSPLLPSAGGGGNSYSTSTDDNLSYGVPFTRPDHILPASFFQVHIPFNSKLNPSEEGGKVNSFVTILSIWNTMMGTSLLSVPWAVGKSGLVAALAIGAVMATISCFTALQIVDVHAAVDSPLDAIPEFAQLCGRLLGPRWEFAAGITSLGAVVGAVIVYWVLMSNFLNNSVSWIQQKASGTLPTNVTSDIICPKNNTYPRGAGTAGTTASTAAGAAASTPAPVSLPDATVLSILDAIDGGDEAGWSLASSEPEQQLASSDSDSSSTFHRIWNKNTVPVFLLVLFPIICMRSVTFFTKFNCLGSVSVGFILSLICYWSFSWGINADFSDSSSDEYVPLFRSSFPSLSGMLALGLFIHNAIITICKSNRHQENNKRDISIAFCAVIFTYLFVGVMFYVTFPLPKWCIEDNIFNNFQITDTAVVIARMLLLFQLFTVFPLLMYLIRVQLLLLIGLRETMVNIVAVNAVISTLCILFTIFMPNIGTIIRYSGAICGFCMIFTLPGFVKMSALKRDRRLTWRHIALYASIVILGFSNLIAQFLFK